jgi:hypothetical protein
LEIFKQCLRTPYIGAQRPQLFDDSSLMHHSLIEGCHAPFGLFQQIENDWVSHTRFLARRALDHWTLRLPGYSTGGGRRSFSELVS